MGICISAARAESTRAKWFKAERTRAQISVKQLDRLGAAKVTWQAHRTRPSMITGLSIKTHGDSDIQRVRAFLERHPALFMDGASKLETLPTRQIRSRRVVRLQQTYRGLVVEGATIRVTLDDQDRIRAVHTDLEPVHLPTIRPKLSPRQALGVAFKTAAGRNPSGEELARLDSSSARLIILPGPTQHLAYKVMLPFGINPLGRFLMIDARTGQYLGSRRGVIVHRKEVRP
jgi:Zn-dependent metalloprotease